MKNWINNLKDGVDLLRRYKRSQTDITTWFYVQEIKMQEQQKMLKEGFQFPSAFSEAELLCRVVKQIPLSIPEGSAIAGSQDGAFSASYALINPDFKVENFTGYCDPCAAYSDLTPNQNITQERIARVRQYWSETNYVHKLNAISQDYAGFTGEVVFFMEPVTGHTIPDMRPFLKKGLASMKKQAMTSNKEYGQAMARSIDAVSILLSRYREIAIQQMANSDNQSEHRRLTQMIHILSALEQNGASTLHEAIQLFTLLWQVMIIEQAPNPYAFSVGNLDRILAPYCKSESYEEAVELVRHLLCFFQVGNRCWAISQNIMVGGRDLAGNDCTDRMTEIILEAFFESNDPQPALSVKVHSKTPETLYQNLGRFFFTPGHSTPSLFNDDSIFPMLANQAIAKEDLQDYSIAGCQEPLIMGKSSLNTTNTWLNLAKILELALNDGKSTITGKQLCPEWHKMDLNEASVFADPQTAFLKYLDYCLPVMEQAGNACTELLGQEKPVPFTSSLMDSFSSFRDMRDPHKPGTRYNGSGCLIHGLSVITDSFIALETAMSSQLWTTDEIRTALTNNYQEYGDLKSFLSSQEKYGNNNPKADQLAADLMSMICQRIGSLKNPANNPFLADFSTPSTHLLYGYWVGATPDGRDARTMLGYGIDPRPESSCNELPEQILTFRKLPYHKMTGGYASHIGICPVDAELNMPLEKKGLWLKDRVISPLFRLGENVIESPFYVYFNIDTVNHLRAILENPKKLAPSGIYIMRIHGTFVNFLDLSPEIQDDIIQRLEAGGKVA